jgi:hypothetical protein
VNGTDDLRALDMGPFAADVDAMQDVYMTRSQREAYTRILAAARMMMLPTTALSQPTAGGEAVAWFCTEESVRKGRKLEYPYCATMSPEYVAAHPGYNWKPLYTTPVVAGEAVRGLIEAAKKVEHSYLFEGPDPYDVFSKVDQDALQCLVRALAALATDGWQPIETAPKDSRTILVAVNGFVTGAYRCPHSGSLLTMIGQRPFVEQPTHWMPLPTPPAAAKGE